MDSTETTPSLFLFETPPITDEAFNLFYAIDRELYARLIRNLARNPIESMQVVALWIWLEKQRNANLIHKILSLPLVVLKVLVDESVICLGCIEGDTFPSPVGGEQDPSEITLLPEIVNRGPALSLRYFRENRARVSRGVTKVITTICSRAFKDILQNHMLNLNSSVVMGGGSYEVGESSVPVDMRDSINVINNNSYGYNNIGGDVHHQYLHQGGGGVVNVPVMYHHPNAYHGMVQPPFVPVVPVQEAHVPINIPANEPFQSYGDLLPASFAKIMLVDDLSEVFGGNLSVNNNNADIGADDDDRELVAPDDRTIFLTFSKGYPTTEDEVRQFFTRKFGNFIEDVIMQEVEEGEQSLYAKMVCRSLSVIQTIVAPNKAKYNINGKHVWARKYVKKLNTRGDRNA